MDDKKLFLPPDEAQYRFNSNILICLAMLTAMILTWAWVYEDELIMYKYMFRPGNREWSHESLRNHIMEASAAHNLDPALIAAVIKSESAFDSQAVSRAGAKGLMQLMPGTAKDMGCHDPFDPRENIMGGSRYLRLMLNRFDEDLTLALAAYNAGPEKVARHGGVPNIAETRSYVKIVKNNYEKYKGEF